MYSTSGFLENPQMRLFTIVFMKRHLVPVHSLNRWASASRPMPPASTFQHPVSQSPSEAFRYRTGSPYSGSGLDPLIPVPDWFRHRPFYIPVPDWPKCRTVRHSDIWKTLYKGEKDYPYYLHVHTASDGLGYTLYLHVHTAGGGKVSYTSILQAVKRITYP